MGKRYRILSFASWYPTKQDPQLGIFTKMQIEAISKDHDVTLVTLQPSNSILNHKKARNSFEHTNHSYSPNGVLKPVQWYLAWRKIIGSLKADQFDLIHLHVSFPMGLIVLMAQKRLNLPLVLSEHWSGYAIPKMFRGSLRKSITQKIVQNASVIVAMSNFLKEKMQLQGLHGNYEVIPNIVNFVATNSEPKNNSELIYLMNISDHINQTKNISGLLKAFSQAYKKNDNIRLIQIGDGPDSFQLKKLSSDLGLSEVVEWKGRLTNDQVLKEIHQADFGIINSSIETFSVVSFEFLAAKKPIIISRCGGPEEYLPEGFGKKVSIMNDNELCDSILEMTENYQSYKMDKVSDLVKKQFSESEFRHKMNRVYQQVIDG